MTEWSRGDVVVCVVPDAYGKPRPAVIMQANKYNQAAMPESVLVCPLSSFTGNIPPYRVKVPAGQAGIEQDSLIMADKLSAIPSEKVREVIGTLWGRPIGSLTNDGSHLCEPSCGLASKH